MARLMIDLQDGFRDDTVVIRVDGREVYRKTGVSTRFQIGLAEQVKIELSEGPAQIDVSLPDRDESLQVAVDGSTPWYLGVTLTPAGRIEFRRQTEPFGYL